MISNFDEYAKKCALEFHLACNFISIFLISQVEMRVLSDTKEGSIDDGGCEKEAYRRSKQPTMAKICYVVQLQRKHSYQNPIQLGFPLMGLILELEKMCYGKYALV